ncbi:MAG: hypothetical protein J0L99_00730 [Chitinophagales bacterium]|nr:hypothetical protein [Chitinophagales bacterium]
MQKLSILLFIAFLTGAFWACQSNDYTSMRARELNSGVRHDQLFMGFYLGQSRDSFYRQCLEMNKKGIITNGPENSSVLFTFPDQYKFPMDMNFYPEFNNDRISKMNILFSYQSWAPWNKKCFSDKVLPDAMDVLQKWFGSGFVDGKSEKIKSFKALVNGNREIIVYLQNEKNVRVEINDLTAPLPTPQAPQN